MAKLTLLQQSWTRGYKRDGSRDDLPKGTSWNIVDFLPDLQAKLRKRGGWTWGSDAFTTVHAGSDECVALTYTDFLAGSKLCAVSRDVGVDARLITVNPTTQALALIGTLNGVPAQNPVLHNNLLVIPQGAGTTAPQSYDGVTTLANLAGTPPTGMYGCVYKDRTILARTQAKPNWLYFSKAGDPLVWDTTNSWWAVTQPITGLAALPNSLLIFGNTITARLRGSTPPPGTDMILDDPIFAVGCTDARSIVVNGGYCAFANPTGVYLSNGTNLPEDLTQSCGIKRYWVELLQAYDSATWTLAGGTYNNQYVITIMNGGTFIDCLMFDIDARNVVRLSNMKALCYAHAVTIGEELYFGLKSAGRVGKFSSVWTPSAAVKTDADGTAVAPLVETVLYRDRPGKKTWRSLYVTYDMRDAANDNPILNVSYIRNPEDAYTQLPDPLTETTNYFRARRPLRFPADAIAVKIQQQNASAETRIYDLEADLHERELSRLN